MEGGIECVWDDGGRWVPSLMHFHESCLSRIRCRKLRESVDCQNLEATVVETQTSMYPPFWYMHETCKGRVADTIYEQAASFDELGENVA